MENTFKQQPVRKRLANGLINASVHLKNIGYDRTSELFRKIASKTKPNYTNNPKSPKPIKINNGIPASFVRGMSGAGLIEGIVKNAKMY